MRLSLAMNLLMDLMPIGLARQVVSLSPAMPGKRGANLPEDNQDKDTAIRAAASTTDDAVPKRKRGVTP